MVAQKSVTEILGPVRKATAAEIDLMIENAAEPEVAIGKGRIQRREKEAEAIVAARGTVVSGVKGKSLDSILHLKIMNSPKA